MTKVPPAQAQTAQAALLFIAKFNPVCGALATPPGPQGAQRVQRGQRGAGVHSTGVQPRSAAPRLPRRPGPNEGRPGLFSENPGRQRCSEKDGVALKVPYFALPCLALPCCCDRLCAHSKQTGFTRRRRAPAGRRGSWSAPWRPRQRGQNPSCRLLLRTF